MRPTEPFRQEHRELLSHIEHLREAAQQVAVAAPEDRREVVERVLRFLRHTLLPHARAEEEVLYPEWSELVGFAEAAVPMVHDHEAIAERVERLAAADPDDVPLLQELLYGLYALVGVHFRKEEDIQLPAFDVAPPEVVERVLERMEAVAPGAHSHA